jgi:hypothetical protein
VLALELPNQMRVSWAEPDRRFAPRIVERLYGEADSPLRYRINRLGGRSKPPPFRIEPPNAKRPDAAFPRYFFTLVRCLSQSKSVVGCAGNVPPTPP